MPPLSVSVASPLTVVIEPLNSALALDEMLTPPVPLTATLAVAETLNPWLEVMLVSPVEVVSMVALDSLQPMEMPLLSIAI